MSQTAIRRGARVEATTPTYQSDKEIRSEYKKQKAWGLLASIDLHGCDNQAIQDPAKIRAFVIELCERIDMVRHGECLVESFAEGDLFGYSMFQFIETSSITGHFDHLVNNAAYIDIFSCKYFNPVLAADFAKEYFGAKDYNLHHLLRV